MTEIVAIDPNAIDPNAIDTNANAIVEEKNNHVIKICN